MSRIGPSGFLTTWGQGAQPEGGEGEGSLIYEVHGRSSSSSDHILKRICYP